MKIKFIVPWIYFPGVTLRVSQQLLDELKAGTNEQWNTLVAELELSVSFLELGTGRTYVHLSSEATMNPIRAAERFVDFPGVEYISSGSGNLQGWEDHLVRVASTNGAKYYFKHCTCPDLYDTYTYVEVGNGSANLLGVHAFCFASMVSGDGPFDFERFTFLLDSLEAARPAWADTARTAIGNFGRGQYFRWP